MSTYPELGPALAGITATDPQGWDRCQLGNAVLPGHSKIVNAEILVKCDRKSKPGANVARPTFHGVDPQPVHIELTTYSDADREAFADQCKAWLPGDKKDPNPISFDHPSTRHLGIKVVVVLKIGPMILKSPSIATVKIECLDWRPSKTKPKGATKTPLHKINDKLAAANETKNPTPTSKGIAAGFASVLRD